MDSYLDKLNITPRSTTELHSVLDSFEQKWQYKARHAQTDERASGF